MTWDEIRELAKTLPGVEDGTYHGYPALRVNGKYLTRRADDGIGLTLKGWAFDEREMLTEADPEVFYTIPGHQELLFARMATVDPTQLLGLLRRRWRLVAPKKMVKALDDGVAWPEADVGC